MLFSTLTATSVGTHIHFQKSRVSELTLKMEVVFSSENLAAASQSTQCFILLEHRLKI
jgi:hypothetical protein